MNKNNLEKNLELARPFLMSQEFIPILTHFVFNGETIVAFNDLQAIELKYKSELNCGIPGILLVRFLDTLSSENIDVLQKDQTVEFKAGKTNLKLPILPSDEFIYKEPDLPREVTLSSILLLGLQKCLISVGNTPTHPECNGITLILEREKVTLYSTDQKSVSKFSIYEKTNLGLGEKIVLIIPTFFCQQLIKLFDEFCVPNDPITLNFSKDGLAAKLKDRCTIFTKLIEAENSLDFEGVMNQFIPDVTKLTFDDIRTDLMPALNRSILLVNLGETGTKTSNFKISENIVEIFTNSSMGKAKDILEFEKDFKTLTFELDPLLLRRALETSTKISFQDNVVITANDDCHYLHMISHVNPV